MKHGRFLPSDQSYPLSRRALLPQLRWNRFRTGRPPLPQVLRTAKRSTVPGTSPRRLDAAKDCFHVLSERLFEDSFSSRWVAWSIDRSR